ncbi:hypothetical protein BGZ76_004821 [Entomortierella beljakovae]|nr:hypothetical protein BGZ76_004821 [Entomortierella beljakovae]
MDSSLGTVSSPNSLNHPLSNNPFTNDLIDSQGTSFQPNPQTVHLRPSTGDGSLKNDGNTTLIDSNKPNLGNGLLGDVGSRADVFVGVVIFSVGMIVLIGAMIFYFVNGKSWRAIKEQSNGQEIDEEAGDPKEKSQICSKLTSESSTGDEDNQIQGSDNNVDHGTSPSTARLVDPPTKSVFGFLKGTQRQFPAAEGNSDPLDNAMLMPALTRTKARSSIKRKSGSNSQPCSSVAESSKGHVMIDIQEQELSFNPASSADLPAPSSLFARMARKQRLPESIVAAKAIARSNRSTAPTLLRLEMPPHTNPSIIGLYGSAKSSPNGSLADAASVQAIYSRSLRSAMSYNTYTESSLALDCSEQESKEVVLTTVDIAHQRD